MVKSNTDALGIIFPNAYDSLIPEMVTQRTMASIPFGGRYRMIDFVLSSFANFQHCQRGYQQHLHHRQAELSFPDGPSGRRP